MTRPCIDLRTLGGNYRVWNDRLDRKAHARDDAWDLAIRGRTGTVIPWGDSTLAVCTKSARTTHRLLAVVPGAEACQPEDGGGANVVFQPDQLDAVHAVVRLKKRRRCHLTADQLRAAAERLTPHRFRPQTYARTPTPERDGTAPAKSGGFRPPSRWPDSPGDCVRTVRTSRR